jgi:hypothetical protein
MVLSGVAGWLLGKRIRRAVRRGAIAAGVAALGISLTIVALVASGLMRSASGGFAVVALFTLASVLLPFGLVAICRR